MTPDLLGSSPLASFTIGMIDDDVVGPEIETGIAPEATAHTFTGLLPNHNYRFRIKATNIKGTSDWSDYTVQIRPGVQPTRPGLITFPSTTRTTIDYTFELLTG